MKVFISSECATDTGIGVEKARELMVVGLYRANRLSKQDLSAILGIGEDSIDRFLDGIMSEKEDFDLSEEEAQACRDEIAAILAGEPVTVPPLEQLDAFSVDLPDDICLRANISEREALESYFAMLYNKGSFTVARAGSMLGVGIRGFWEILARHDIELNYGP